jgi:hypothetical protein
MRLGMNTGTLIAFSLGVLSRPAPRRLADCLQFDWRLAYGRSDAGLSVLGRSGSGSEDV